MKLTNTQIEAIQNTLSRWDSGLWSRGGVNESDLLNAIFEAALTEKQEPWCKAMNRCESKCDDCPDPAPEAKQGPETVKAGEVAIGVLCERKGFDDWWDGIDADLQQEILTEINDTHPAPVNQQLLEFAKWVLSLKTGGMIEGKARAAIAAAEGKV